MTNAHMDELGRRLVLDRTAAALDDAQAWLNGRLDEPVERRSFRRFGRQFLAVFATTGSSGGPI